MYRTPAFDRRAVAILRRSDRVTPPKHIPTVNGCVSGV